MQPSRDQDLQQSFDALREARGAAAASNHLYLGRLHSQQFRDRVRAERGSQVDTLPASSSLPEAGVAATAYRRLSNVLRQEQARLRVRARHMPLAHSGASSMPVTSSVCQQPSGGQGYRSHALQVQSVNNQLRQQQATQMECDDVGQTPQASNLSAVSNISGRVRLREDRSPQSAANSVRLTPSSSTRPLSRARTPSQQLQPRSLNDSFSQPDVQNPATPLQVGMQPELAGEVVEQLQRPLQAIQQPAQESLRNQTLLPRQQLGTNWINSTHQSTRAERLERVHQSFVTTAVPDAIDLGITAERDPDAALLLFHETGGLWRFQSGREVPGVPTDNSSSSNSGSPPEHLHSVLKEINEESCTAERCNELMTEFYERLARTIPIFSCACCGMKSYVQSLGQPAFQRVQTSSPLLEPLKLSSSQENDYQSIGANAKALSAWPDSLILRPGQARFWLHPELVDTDASNNTTSAILCTNCCDALGKSRPVLPERSIAAGIDFGNAERLGLPALTLVEKYLISPVRLYGSVIKLVAAERDREVRVLNGHLIAFEQFFSPALEEIAQLEYPRIGEVAKLVTVNFLGTRSQFDKMLNGGRPVKELMIRPDVVFKWLEALQALNPMYKHIRIVRSSAMRQQMVDLQNSLLREAEVADDVGIAINSMVQTDAARVHWNTQQNEDDISRAFQASQDDAGCQDPPLPAVFLRSNVSTARHDERMHNFTAMQAIRNVVAAPQANGGQSAAGPQVEGSTVPGQPSVPRSAIRVGRAETPLNEFSSNNVLFHGAFPWLFLLGKGVTTTGSLPAEHIQHILLQFSGQFASCRWLLFALMNQQMRHAAVRAITASVNCHPDSVVAWNNLISDPSFVQSLDEHMKTPDSPAAKLFLAKITPFFYSSAAKVPYGPTERRDAMTTMYSMVQRFGTPSVFLTISPDDACDPLVLRLAMPFLGNKTFPAVGDMYGGDYDAFLRAVESGDTHFEDIAIADPIQKCRLRKLAAENPVSAAQLFKRLMGVVLEHLVGIEPELKGGRGGAGKAKKTVPLQSRRRGIFGRITAYFTVVETQGRLSLHAHACLWGGLTPSLLQRAAGNIHLTDAVAAVLDSFFSARLEPQIHVQDLLRRINKASASRPSRLPPVFPGVQNATQYDSFVNDTMKKACFTQLHKHSFTCKKGKTGSKFCRVSRPASLVPGTAPVELLPALLTATNREEMSASILEGLDVKGEDCSLTAKRDRMTHPLPENDQRCIVWELMRERINVDESLALLDPAVKTAVDGLDDRVKKLLMDTLAVRNSAVVEFSPILTQCLGANNAALLLGSEEQARAALFYLVKYMTKDSTALSNTLTIVRQALNHVHAVPSVAADAGTASRNTKYFLQRIVNGLTGLSEISDTQCAAHLLGMPSNISSVQTVYTFAKAACAFQHELHLSDQLPGTACDNPMRAWDGDSDIEDRSDDDFTTRPDNRNISDEMDEHGRLESGEVNMQEMAVGGDDTTTNRGALGRAEIFYSNGRSIPVAQHIHYRFRGPAFERFGFYEWAACVKVERKKATANDSLPPRAAFARGRPENGVFEFAEGHPLKLTHVQKLRSKQQCPILAGGPPPKYPGPMMPGRTAQWKKRADSYARYMLTMFKPWDLVTGHAWNPSTNPWNSFCSWMNVIDPHPDSMVTANFLGMCRAATICNVSRALSVNTERKHRLTLFRNRAARDWKSTEQDYACDFDILLDGTTSVMPPPQGAGVSSELEQQAVAEIDRLLALTSASRTANDQRPKGHSFVESTLDYLNDFLPLPAENSARPALAECRNCSGSMVIQRGGGTQGGNLSINEILELIQSPIVSADQSAQASTLNRTIPCPGNPLPLDEVIALIDALSVPDMTALSNALRGSTNIQDFINAHGWSSQVESALASSTNRRSALQHVEALLSKPNAEQQALIDAVMTVAMEDRAHQAGGNQNRNRGRNLLVLGGPGVGKTHFVKKLRDELEKQGGALVSFAFTGVAASNLPGGRTLHSLLCLKRSDGGQEKLQPLDDAQVCMLQSKVRDKTFLLIDEISMVGPALLGMLHERLCQALHCNEPFGGLKIIALGDFYQLQPVNGCALFTDIMQRFAIPSSQRNNTIRGSNYASSGSNLFSQFRLSTLSVQMRAIEDNEHTWWVNALRALGSGHPITDAFLDLLLSKKFTRQCLLDDPSWAWAPIAVTSNLEKQHIDFRQSKAFAFSHGVPVVVWRHKVTSPGTLNDGSILSEAEYSALCRQEPGLMGIFVKGAPAFLSKNFKGGGVERGLANGTSCTMHSLTFREDTPEQINAAMRAKVLIEAARPGDVVDLGTLVPYTVNAVHSMTDTEAASWPSEGSLLPPVIDDVARVGSVVVPVVCDWTDELHVQAVLPRWPGGTVRVQRHGIEPGFAITFHKLQGKTVDKLILDLRNRPGSAAGIPAVTYEGLYVAWTRVRRGDHIRVIPPMASSDGFEYLKRLGPSKHLVCWLQGFVQEGNGSPFQIWNCSKAKEAWEGHVDDANTRIRRTRRGAGGRRQSALGASTDQPNPPGPADQPNPQGPDSDQSLTTLTCDQLRGRLRGLGLAVSGRKADLVRRLLEGIRAQQQNGQSSISAGLLDGAVATNVQGSRGQEAEVEAEQEAEVEAEQEAEVEAEVEAEQEAEAEAEQRAEQQADQQAEQQVQQQVEQQVQQQAEPGVEQAAGGGQVQGTSPAPDQIPQAAAATRVLPQYHRTRSRTVNPQTAAARSTTLDREFPPAQVSAIINMAGYQTLTGQVLGMGTFSWFWAPIIGHAYGDANVRPLPADAVLHTHGAAFSLSNLVHEVRNLVNSGAYSVHATEIRNDPGQPVYFAASAQDRLLQTLKSTQNGYLPGVYALATRVEWWFDYLYKRDVLAILHSNATNGIVGKQNLQALPWSPHWALDSNGHLVEDKGTTFQLISLWV